MNTNFVSENKVIGGEFSIQLSFLKKYSKSNTDTYLNKNYLFFPSGRNALFHILKDISQEDTSEFNEIFIPNYICNSVVSTINDARWKLSYYNLDSNFRVDINDVTLIKRIKVLLLVDYFGCVDLSSDISEIRRINKDIIIADCVQSFFKLDLYESDYSFTSLRKMCEIPLCSIARKNKNSPFYKSNQFLNSKIDLTLNSSNGRWYEYKFLGNLLKSFPSIFSDKCILNLLKHGEYLLDRDFQHDMAVPSYLPKMLNAVDFDNIKIKRKANAALLHKELNRLNIKHLFNDSSVPLFVPIFIKNRDVVRKKMFENNIFPPIHWPVLTSLCSEIVNSELSLICDQRYTDDDMLKQISILENIIE
ncbi:MAG: hypothetical protein SPF26_08500 [Succinivibrio sp.]|nr:hypothetical protein [Succinivibrio sp.]